MFSVFQNFKHIIYSNTLNIYTHIFKYTSLPPQPQEKIQANRILPLVEKESGCKKWTEFKITYNSDEKPTKECFP